jgi:putative modified peptide
MSFKMPEAIIDSLLDRLGTDDEFRACFAADARTALVSLGFAPAADSSIVRGAWTCIQVTELASKEAIQASREIIRRQLVLQSAAQMPISLQAQQPVRQVA